MSARKLSRSLTRAVVDAQQTAAHCSTTIGARLPILGGYFVSPTEAALAEWNAAYTEKVAAAWEGAIAASVEWQAMMMRSAFRAPNPLVFADDMLGVMNKAAHPARRRVKANARRLSRAKKG